METLISMLDNVFVMLTGMPPTLGNFATAALTAGFVLTGIFYVLHAIQAAVLRSMSADEKSDLLEELRQKS